MGSWLRSWFRWFVARFRLNLRVVCEESRLLGVYDHHDWPDSIEGHPDHFTLLTCKRCRKQFMM